MLLKNIAGKNYFIALLILLGITIILVISTFIITAFYPEALGKNPYTYEISNVCHFEPWAFESDDLEVYFPDGGIIVTIKETEYKRGVLLLGEEKVYQNQGQQDNNSLGGLFMVIDDNLFETIRGDNIFVPVEEQETLEEVYDIVEKQEGIPSIWEEQIPLSFHEQEGLVYYYFITEDGEPLMPPSTNTSLSTLVASFSIYIILFLILLLLITIFSPEHRYSRYWIHLGSTDPGIYNLSLVLVLAGMYYISETVPILYGLEGSYSTLGYLAALFMLVLFSRLKVIDYLDLGLRRETISSGYPTGIFISLVMLISIRGIPAGFDLGGEFSLLHLPLTFLLIGLPHEMIWRGYIQNILTRKFGPNLGFIGMITLAALVHFAIISSTQQWMLAYPYTYLELAVLVPGTAAILGYLYLRTENILSCALLHSLLIFLPGIILF